MKIEFDMSIQDALHLSSLCEDFLKEFSVGMFVKSVVDKAIDDLEEDARKWRNAPPSDPNPSEAEVFVFQSGKKIEAIMMYRRRTHCGLRDAKDNVEKAAGYTTKALEVTQ